MAEFIPGQLLRQRSYRPETGPILILSVSDAGQNLDGEPFPNGGTIYAESISVSKNSEFNSDVSLYTNHFTVTVPQGQGSVVIDVSGKDGSTQPKDVGGDSTAATQATPSHNLTVYAETMTFEEIKCLGFRAKGGRGAEGSNGIISNQVAGAAGGNGQGGGVITTVLGTPLQQAIFVARAIADSKLEFPVKVTQALGMIERRRQQMTLLCNLCCALVREPKPGAADDHDSAALRRDLGGWTRSLVTLHSLPWAVYPQEDERTIVRNILSLLSARLERLRTQLVRSWDTRGGFGGAGGQGTQTRGSNGTAGQNGKLNLRFHNMLPEATRKLSLPIAHPDQCAMLLQVAKINYFQDRREDARIQLVALYNRLLWVHNVCPEDPIYQAYASAETSMYIVPNSTLVPGKQLTSIEQLRAILTETEKMSRQLASQVDFYGHDPTYVPRGSYNFYQELLGKLLAGLKTAQDAHALYFQASQKQETKSQALQTVKALITDSVKQANGSIDKVEAIMASQETLARGLDGQMKAAATELAASIKLVEEKIAALTPSLGIDFMDLVEAATMLCFSPTPAMVMTQAAGLGYKAYSKSGIEDDKGDVIKQDLLLEGFRSIESSTTSLLGAYNDVMATKSGIQVQDPHATKLIADKNDMEKLIKGYTKQLGKASLNDVSSKFQAYIDVTLRRNDAIMQYNNAANLWLQKRQEVSQLKTQKSIATNPAATKDPDLPAVALFMERSYNRTLWTTMENLYLTERALRFWTLDDEPIVKTGLGDNPASNMTHATLSQISTDLLDAYSKMLEQLGVKQSNFYGTRVHLAKDALKQLITTRETFITIPPVFSWTTSNESPFAGMCCIRLTKARFFLPGAVIKPSTDKEAEEPKKDIGPSTKEKGEKDKADDKVGPRLLVAVTHLGRETMLDTSRVEHTFLHDQIYMHFKYPLSLASNPASFVPGKEEETIDADIGEKINSEYALVGPFTTWRIQIPKELNHDDLDLSRVTDGFFYFDGMFYPLAPTPRPVD